MRRREIWVKPEVRQTFEAKIVETIAKCEPHWRKEPITVPKLVFRNSGAAAGQNLFSPFKRTSVITINPLYFNKEGGYEEQLNKTLPHEVAHHVTDFIYGCGSHNKTHGWQWARVMGWIGLPADRCHMMDAEGIASRRERPYKYTCGCSEYLITIQRHVKIANSNGRRWLNCRKCRNRLTYVGIVVNGHFTPVAAAKPNNEIKTVRLAPRVIGVTFVPPEFKPEPPKVIPESGFRVVTRMIGGVLQNVRIPNTP